MATHRLVWLEIAEQQYLDLPDEVRNEVDRMLGDLERDPLALPQVVYHRPSDQWSAPIGDQGFVFYAVVQERSTVIILRVIHIPAA